MFKKIYIFICSIFLFVILAVNNNGYVLKGEKHFLYLSSASSQAQIVKFEDYKGLGKVCGESCEIDKESFSLDEVLKDYGAKLLFTEETEDVKIYYAYSKDIKYFSKIKNMTVNLEIAVSKNLVTLGSPLIFGSF